MMNRDEKIEALIEYQLECIYDCQDYQTVEDVLKNIFTNGLRGYNTMTDAELDNELIDAGVYNDYN